MGGNSNSLCGNLPPPLSVCFSTCVSLFPFPFFTWYYFLCWNLLLSPSPFSRWFSVFVSLPPPFIGRFSCMISVCCESSFCVVYCFSFSLCVRASLVFLFHMVHIFIFPIHTKIILLVQAGLNGATYPRCIFLGVGYD